jgi:hypothetical protein
MNQIFVMKNENNDISNMEKGTKLPEIRITIDRNEKYEYSNNSKYLNIFHSIIFLFLLK